MTEAEQRSTGVTPETLRLCIGIEHVEYIIADRAGRRLNYQHVVGGFLNQGSAKPICILRIKSCGYRTDKSCGG